MKKKFFILTSIMVLLIAMVGFWGYTKYFKPDPEIQQQLDNQFGAEFFTSFDDEKVVNKPEAVNDVKPVEDLPETIVSPKTPEKVNEQGESQKPPVKVNTTEKLLTQDQISTKYKPQFIHLQNVALSRLDTLYSAAIEEYVQRSKAGTLNRSELAQKYIQAGNKLEANVDIQFNKTLNDMQAELIANNLPTDSLSVTKAEYEKAKSDKRSQLLAKIRK